MLFLFRQSFHRETFYPLKVPGVEGKDRKTEGNGGRGNDEIVGTYELTFLSEVCPDPGVDPSCGELKGVDGKEFDNPLDVGFSFYPSGLRIGTMNTMEEFRDTYDADTKGLGFTSGDELIDA